MKQIKNQYEVFLPVEEDLGSLNPQDRISQAAAPLVHWFQGNKRDLPWRQTPTPYHVWLSEIMLQQTRVEAVISYYNRFLEALPTIYDLAEVEEDTLLKLWQGLGYYNRARNLKKAAVEAVEQHGGNLPADYKKLLDMPGIGPYTAGAIASIAWNLPEPAVDGNVLRVLSRLLASEKDIASPAVRKEMEGWIKTLLVQENQKGKQGLNPSDYNQALMELGALVCIPNGAPHCQVCPWEGICLAHKRELTDRIPYKAPKKARRIEEKTVLIIRGGEQIALHKRPATGLLANLYEYPNLEGHMNQEKLMQGLKKHDYEVSSVINGKHIFTHVEWHMKGYEILVPEDVSMSDALTQLGTLLNISMDGVEPYTWQEMKEQIPIPSAFQAFTTYLDKKLSIL